MSDHNVPENNYQFMQVFETLMQREFDVIKVTSTRLKDIIKNAHKNHTPDYVVQDLKVLLVILGMEDELARDSILAEGSDCYKRGYEQGVKDRK